MRRVAAFFMAALAALPLPARAEGVRAEPVRVDLYTIGRGSYLWAAYGHTVPCVMVSDSIGQCYDYAIPDTEGDLDMVWGTLRGRPVFTIKQMSLDVMLATFQEMDRPIEVQTLPLSPEEMVATRDALEGAHARGEHYAYHPCSANCATKVRDVIDQVTHGKLSAGGRRGEGPTYRVRIEDGLRGHLWPLFGLAIGLGPQTDHDPPTDFEQQFLPLDLRDGVERHFGVKPVTVFARPELVRPSAAAGRWLAVGLGALLAGLIALARRRPGRAGPAAVAAAGALLGLCALFLDVVALGSAWVEFQRHWSLLLFLPTDLALGALGEAPRRRYLLGRLALVAALAALSVVGVISQPLVAPALLVGLPLLALLPRQPRGQPAG